jgi:hypothetical protein
MTTNPNPTDPLDPHDLASSGEPLATPKELARLLGLSRSELETLLHRELAGRVRFVRTPPGGGKWRYSIEDAKAVPKSIDERVRGRNGEPNRRNCDVRRAPSSRGRKATGARRREYCRIWANAA